MRTLCSILSFWLVFAPSAICAKEPQPPTLCTRHETVFFSCATANKRIVSVCGAKKPSVGFGVLQYRFGTPTKLELVLPAGDAPHALRFRLYHYSRPLVDRIGLSFDTNGYSYTVFYHDEGDETPPIIVSGVDVLRTGDPAERTTTKHCNGPVTDRLATLEGTVPCDKENALANCPD
jgi:hypothetical protein